MRTKKIAGVIAAGTLLSTLIMPAYAHDREDDNSRYQVTQSQQQSDSEQQNEFNDVGGYGWAATAIAKLSQQGIIKGVDKHHFAPGQQITRAQFATLLTRFFNLPRPTTTTQDFVDVPSFAWEYPYVEAAKDYMTAYRDLSGGLAFHPDEPMNRESVAVTLTEILVHEKVIQMDTPDQVQQVMQYFYDSDQIAQGIRTEVATAITNKLMNGVGDQMFDPLGILNRAQAAVLLYRVENNLAVAPGQAVTITGSTTSTGGTASSTTTPTGTSGSGGAATVPSTGSTSTAPSSPTSASSPTSTSTSTTPAS